MDTNVKIYSEEEIIALVSALEGSEDSFKWLLKNCIELAAVADAIAYGKKTAEEWLEKNGYKLLSEFIAALIYDANPAYEYLDNYPQKEWAAIVDYINDDDDQAMLWLFKSHLKHFAALAGILKKIIKSKESTGIGGLSGGGGFGGAGAGGAW